MFYVVVSINNRYFVMIGDLVSHDRLLTKMEASGVDSKVVVWVREFLVGRKQRVSVTRERFGPTTVSSVRKRYLEEHRLEC